MVPGTGQHSQSLVTHERAERHCHLWNEVEHQGARRQAHKRPYAERNDCTCFQFHDPIASIAPRVQATNTDASNKNFMANDEKRAVSAIGRKSRIVGHAPSTACSGESKFIQAPDESRCKRAASEPALGTALHQSSGVGSHPITVSFVAHRQSLSRGHFLQTRGTHWQDETRMKRCSAALGCDVERKAVYL
jgi:hypothetical protein